MNDKVFVYDNPKVITQLFRVSLPENRARIFVKRKEVIREQHNMGCTDGMKDGERQTIIDYEFWKEVGQDERVACINAVRKELKKMDSIKIK